MGAAGGRLVLDEIETIKEEIGEYFGGLNEFKLGARGTPPRKPEILMMYEDVTKSGLPLVAGGYVDQPYLTSLYLEIARDEVKMWEHLNSLAQVQPNGAM